MRIFAVDDEPNMLYLLHDAIAEAVPEAEIEDFGLGAEAVARIEGGGPRPDAVFSDIRMPGLSGLELAAKLKALSPGTKLVFVTGYDHAIDAYQLHVDGYITKPVESERVREELEHLFPEGWAEAKKLRVLCFGSFEVFWKELPLPFARKRTKELLAYLVDRRGALCTTDEITAALWEDAEEDVDLKHRLWNLKNDLKSTLSGIGMEAVLVNRGQRMAVRTDLLSCDYYRLLSGDAPAETFRGEYMEQYSWAEPTKASLVFQYGM